MIPHLLRYLPAHALQWQAGQGLAVDDYGVALDVLNLGNSRLSINLGQSLWSLRRIEACASFRSSQLRAWSRVSRF
jgi:hypothetical protein